MTNTVEIYLKDLLPEAQRRVLLAAGATADDNWELSPIAILDYEIEE